MAAHVWGRPAGVTEQPETPAADGGAAADAEQWRPEADAPAPLEPAEPPATAAEPEPVEPPTTAAEPEPAEAPTVVAETPVETPPAETPPPEPPAETPAATPAPVETPAPAPAPAPPVAPPPSFAMPASQPPVDAGRTAAGRPEVVAGAAFAGGFLLALILKRLAR